mgnify:CR=1 FL=1
MEGALEKKLEQRRLEREQTKTWPGNGEGWTDGDPGKQGPGDDGQAELDALEREKKRFAGDESTWKTRVNARGETIKIHPADEDFIFKFLAQDLVTSSDEGPGDDAGAAQHDLWEMSAREAGRSGV